jgi:hypothetical protein
LSTHSHSHNRNRLFPPTSVMPKGVDIDQADAVTEGFRHLMKRGCPARRDMVQGHTTGIVLELDRSR